LGRYTTYFRLGKQHTPLWTAYFLSLSGIEPMVIAMKGSDGGEIVGFLDFVHKQNTVSET
jgi:hypothetical protein